MDDSVVRAVIDEDAILEHVTRRIYQAVWCMISRKLRQYCDVDIFRALQSTITEILVPQRVVVRHYNSKTTTATTTRLQIPSYKLCTLSVFSERLFDSKKVQIPKT